MFNVNGINLEAAPLTVDTPPGATQLRFRGYSLCHGCSNGRHREHQPVDCMCDLPGCAKEPTP